MSNISTEANRVVYWIDRKNIIQRVNENWDDFALANDGGGVTRDQVVGRSIFDFIVGDNTRMWIETVLEHVRLVRQPLAREYRCDSPSEKRFMMMRLTPVEGDLIRLDHETLRVESMACHVPDFVYCGRKASRLTVRCSICNKVKAGEQWVDPDSPEAKLERSTGASTPVAYSVCESCRSMLPKAPVAPGARGRGVSPQSGI